jgi:hypothetical protein
MAAETRLRAQGRYSFAAPRDRSVAARPWKSIQVTVCRKGALATNLGIATLIPLDTRRLPSCD